VHARLHPSERRHLGRERGTVAHVRLRPALIALSAALAAAALAGCGSGSTRYANGNRPPKPATVTGSIDGSRVRLSPGTVGGGPLTILVANLTDRPQKLTFQTASRGLGIRSTATVAANDTGQMSVDVKRGSYELAVRDHSVRPASLKVGKRRPSAQNELLSP
jgi:hypothetical protein